MTSPLQDLRKKIIDSSIAVSDLLRIMYVIVSHKSDIQLLSWIRAELNGYAQYQDVEIPEYRKVIGELKCFNPHMGWIPIIDTGRDAQAMQDVCTRYLYHSICELEEKLKERTLFLLPLEKELELLLVQSLAVDFQPAIIIPINRFVFIINSVRQEILDWSLKLSENDIEKEAQNMLETKENPNEKANHTNITTYHTTVGQAENIMLQQGSSNAHQTLQTNDLKIEEIKRLLVETREVVNGLNTQEKKEAEMYLGIIDSEIEKDDPDKSKIKTIFSYVCRLLENVSANLVANGIIAASPLLVENIGKIKEFIV